MRLPGESQGRGTLAVYTPWGCTELETAEQLNTGSIDGGQTSLPEHYPEEETGCGSWAFEKQGTLQFSLELSLTECGVEEDSDGARVLSFGEMPQWEEVQSQHGIAAGFLFALDFTSSIICQLRAFKEINWVGRDFPDGPVVKTLLSKAGGVSSIPGQGAKIPHTSWPKKKKTQKTGNRNSIVTNSIKAIVTKFNK